MNSSNLDELLEAADKISLDFVISHARKILNETDLDSLQEVPSSPTFEKFLEKTLRPYFVKNLINHDQIDKLISRYRDTFYRSTRPNLRENSYDNAYSPRRRYSHCKA